MTSGAHHPDGPAAQPLRSDAERNRERIIAAARKVFARDGLGASMASVAREAGVGIATMFRRFPAKEELVDAVFFDRMDAYADAVAVALDDPDPWHGFVGYIETACAMQAADSGFADVLTTTFPAAKALERRRNEAYGGMVELIGRAKAAAGCARTSTPRTWCCCTWPTPVSSTPPATQPPTPGGVSSPCWSSPSRPRPAAPCPPRPSMTPSTGPCSAPVRRPLRRRSQRRMRMPMRGATDCGRASPRSDTDRIRAAS